MATDEKNNRTFIDDYQKNIAGYHFDNPGINKKRETRSTEIETELLMRRMKPTNLTTDPTGIFDFIREQRQPLSLEDLKLDSTRYKDVNMYEFTKSADIVYRPYTTKELSERDEKHYWTVPLQSPYDENRHIFERELNPWKNTRLEARDNYRR
ncbi:hypothetical protein [Heterosigma akashiwo virus 01]|jgi:hypothetical protein|uniref:Uncharacterized protein n=1 Tax=Heterosigma akashiwo virus 01 TaxID=97195 RepID=A0A1C9C560_HAV01|nr:hypothetical protein D1R72_gp092 [Heterosigma akashiwo virus 01]AOM63423.1 hypothetical protein [Heterosigma akashiwo virus 01]